MKKLLKRVSVSLLPTGMIIWNFVDKATKKELKDFKNFLSRYDIRVNEDLDGEEKHAMSIITPSYGD